MNDLSSVLKNCKYQLYADDTVIYHTDINVEDSKTNLEQNLERFRDW